MTILTSLLIATQGLLPSPTPLSIGTQGLLQTGEAPPPPPPPIVVSESGGTYTHFRRYERPAVVVKTNGVVGNFTTASVEIAISARVETGSTRLRATATKPTYHLGATTDVVGCTSNLSASRLKPQVSTSFRLVGCIEQDQNIIRALATEALRQFRRNRAAREA
jgi:hypothetical protein